MATFIQANILYCMFWTNYDIRSHNDSIMSTDSGP